MGSGDWFKTIINRKKSKRDKLNHVKDTETDKSNGFDAKNNSQKESSVSSDRASSTEKDSGKITEETAAIRIQNAYRRYRSRNHLRSLKGLRRLEALPHRNTIRKQTLTTLSYIQTWSKIQSEIRARRASMVTETRIKLKRQDNQMKLDAKIHDLEVEWDGGPDTMEEIFSRIHQREEAAVKRERAMAYAFSHQWRANSGHGQFTYDLGHGNWGWSWLERWVAVRPWENRATAQTISPSKAQTKISGKATKIQSPLPRTLSGSLKPYATSDAKLSRKNQTLPSDHGAADEEPKSKPTFISNAKTKNGKVKQEQQQQQLLLQTDTVV